MRYLLTFLSLILFLSGSLKAEELDLSAFKERKLTVGTKVAPPFVIQDENGRLRGISIELWEKVARNLDLQYEYKVYGLNELLDAVSQKEVDIAVGAFTITEERETLMDFTVPYFITSSSIAVRKSEPGVWTFIKVIFSLEFLKAIGGLFLLLLLVGVLVWLVERRKNPEQFGGKDIRGVGAGLWWSAVTMTTVGYGDKAPTTFFGRVLGLIWMFMALIVISSFTAAITSALTVQKLSTYIESPEDLVRVEVGALKESSSEAYLIRKKYNYRTYEGLEPMLNALEQKKIDAVVYDDAILRYFMKNEGFNRNITVLSQNLQQMYYGFALPPGNELREALNREILLTVAEEEWKSILYKYLGYLEGE
jgi:polar amino acid transport system substrate-binding protein